MKALERFSWAKLAISDMDEIWAEPRPTVVTEKRWAAMPQKRIPKTDVPPVELKSKSEFLTIGDFEGFSAPRITVLAFMGAC
jgi:hypothetical protein